MSPSAILEWLLPYNFSPTTLAIFVLAGLWYRRGIKRLRSRGGAPSFWRQLSFWVGLLSCYVVMQTRYDYYSQYMFFMHRLQHLVLHHVGPFLMVLSLPLPVFRAGAPRGVEKLGPVRVLGRVVHWLMLPPVASVLFVALIYFWLWPALHFFAMISYNLYLVMNWSMVIDGLLFWQIIVDPRSPRESGYPRYGVRFLMLWVTAVPQFILGAYIALSSRDLYPIYSTCGRAWPIAAHTDQVLGGIFTWIPAGMMAVIGSLVLIGLAGRNEERELQARRATTNEGGESHA